MIILFLYVLRRIDIQKNIYILHLKKDITFEKDLTARFWSHSSKYPPTLFCNLKLFNTQGHLIQINHSQICMNISDASPGTDNLYKCI